MFDTGEPRTGPELSAALGRLVAEGTTCLASRPDSAFFAPQGTAWSPAEHIRHLRKSSSPLVLALGLPRLLLGIRFGRHRGGSRSFSEIREVYRGALANGGQAGRFTPAPESGPGDTAGRRREIMNAWTAGTVALATGIGRATNLSTVTRCISTKSVLPISLVIWSVKKSFPIDGKVNMMLA